MANGWPLIIYVMPILITVLAAKFFLQAIAPIPPLDQAQVIEGVARIYKQPSREIGTLALAFGDGTITTFGCRIGMRIEPICLESKTIKKRDRYEGRRAVVWTSGDSVALQIQIDGEIVLTYDEALKLINSGGLLGSNTSAIVGFGAILTYWLWVLFGFPYLNYKNWKREL
jgi:hypothetical protein